VSDVSKLIAEKRTQFGKGAARKIRRDHKIPAVMYGHGAEPVHITLPGHDTMLALKVANAVLTIVIDGDEQLALAKDVQRDPIKPVIEHVDLVIVRRGEKVTVDVPVHLEGEAAPETVVTVDAQTLQLEV
jgi:large subunit ribosomal protein L25